MKVAKSLLLGSAAVLATVVGAQAADLPTRKAAPVQYVKICDAYGAGFFYIPGTDTCLRVGGLVLADWAVSNAPNLLNGAPGQLTSWAAYGATAAAPFSNAVALGAASTLPATFRPAGSRDVTASAALGRIELDARTQSPWGTVRTFLRVDSYFGSGAVANTGGFAGLATAGTIGISGMFPARETTVLNKAFIQFAGITMGRIQSMFDFYADAVGYTALRGSNATVNGLAYTFTFGGGFSATLSVEDNVSRRTNLANVANIAQAGFAAWAPVVTNNGTRVPEVVANLRLDQPWGSAQIMGALHQIRGALSVGAPGAFVGFPPAAWQPVTANSFGFAVGGGVKFNLDMLAPGDVLWLQAVYAKGAIGYLSGNNLAFASGGPNNQSAYGAGLIRVSSSSGWQEGSGDMDCVFTFSGGCEKSSGFAVSAALRHYWTPTVSSTLTGSYYQVNYSANALNPVPGALVTNNAAGLPFGWGATNYKEFTLATGLEWNPIRNFGIGAEIAWQHGVTSRPVGLAQDSTLVASGLPAFKSQADLIRGRVRMYRAF